MKDALIVIDMQNAYENGSGWYANNLEEIKCNIKKLLPCFENKYFVRQTLDRNPKGAWIEHTKRFYEIKSNPDNLRLMDCFMEYQEDSFEKYAFSAYSNQALYETVKDCERVYVTGILTECCVLSTVFEGMIRGIPQTVIFDACGGMDAEREKAALDIMKEMKYHMKVSDTKSVIDFKKEEGI